MNGTMGKGLRFASSVLLLALTACGWAASSVTAPGPTCAGAYLAMGLVAPKALTLGAGFVYWIEGSDIRRVAKP